MGGIEASYTKQPGCHPAFFHESVNLQQSFTQLKRAVALLSRLSLSLSLSLSLAFTLLLSTDHTAQLLVELPLHGYHLDAALCLTT